MTIKIAKLRYRSWALLIAAILGLSLKAPFWDENELEEPAQQNQLTHIEFAAFKDSDQNKKYYISYFVIKPGEGKTNRVFVGRDAGHSFVKLLKIDQRTLERETLVFGFYPNFSYLPVFNEKGPSVIRDNEFNRWDYKRRYSVSLNQFNDILDYASSVSLTGHYDLQQFNCTDFVIGLSRFTNNPLPDIQKRWPFGNGSTPIALAESLSNLNGGSRID